MAEEPQPADVHEGLDPQANESETPTNAAEKRGADSAKAAAALSSLDARSGDAASATGTAPSAADQKALGEAMSRLELLDAGAKLGSGVGVGNADKKESAVVSERAKEKARKEKEAEERRKVKVDGGDVAMLVEELELSKIKATELLKMHGGDIVKALHAFLAPA